MSIEYELSLNKLTNPPSYAPASAPRSTMGLQALGQRIAASSTLAPADVQAVLVAFTEIIESELTAGNWVQLDGLGIITTSLKGRVPGPTDPLPDDASIEIGFRSNDRLRRNVRASAQLTRIEPSDQAPLLLALTLKVGGTLPNIAPSNVLEIQGDRLGVNEADASEGVFLIDNTGAAVRVANYLRNGDKQLLFALPAGITPGLTYTLQVRARRKDSIALRTTSWPTLLQGA